MKYNINDLKPHSRNNEFFDDISGEKWREFIESVKSRGVIEPIVITQDKVIVSGHQRTRACKELGIENIECEVRIYDNDDQMLQDLLETNIRQRGDVGGSAKKVGLRIKELERLYGIEHGNNQYNDGHEKNSQAKTQTDLANDMGIDVRTLQNYKQLADMIPELSDLVDTKTVTKTTALAIMKNLSSQEQEELISNLDVTKKYTQKQIQEFIDKNDKLQNQVNQLKNQPPKIVDNTDYTTIKSKENEIQRLREDFKLKNEKILLLEKKAMVYEQNSKEYEKLTNQLESLSKQKDDLSRQITAVTSISGLVIEIENMLSNKLAPVKYSRAITEASQDEIVVENLTQIINTVQQWCDEMKGYLPKENIEFIEAEEIIK